MTPNERKAIREEKIATFNPNENGLRETGIFGLPFGVDESDIVLLPVPWEATVSYAEGTAHGPETILKASRQIDLYDEILPGGWKQGIAMKEISEEWHQASHDYRAQAKMYFQEIGSEEAISPQAIEGLKAVNRASKALNKWVAEETEALLNKGKIVGIVGGEHGVPLGYLETLGKKYPAFGILQIDAHADLRKAYEGFEYSHASIMYNAVQIPQVSKLVQVGIRDFCTEEAEFTEANKEHIQVFTDYAIKRNQFSGKTWDNICEEIIAALPEYFYVSYDIDGLQPWLCPNTGTPVPGGLLLEETTYLIEKAIDAGKKIIGFDLCEVAPGDDEWDGNVGCRVLYKLCLLAMKSGK